MSDSITFLGTSDGLPSADRHHAALLLRLVGQTFLLDSGEPCSHTLKRMGVDFNSIDAVLISHTHSDHVGGLPMLLQSMWLEGRTRPLPVWMPRRAIRPLQQWLRSCFLFESEFGFPIQWRGWSERSTARVGNVKVRPFRTTHLDLTRARHAQRHAEVGFDAFCLLIEAARKRLGYSGDIGSPRDLEPLLRKPLDLLVVELAHVHPDALVSFLRGKAVRRVAITHMSRAVRARLDTVRTRVTGLLRPQRVRFAADGAVIKI